LAGSRVAGSLSAAGQGRPASPVASARTLGVMTETASDDQQFQHALQGEDELGVVVRAHIHVEAALNALIETVSSNPNYIDKMDLEYSQKVRLAVALGLLPQYESPLLALGTRGTLAPRRAVAGSIVLRGAKAPRLAGRLSSNVRRHTGTIAECTSTLTTSSRRRKAESRRRS